MNFTQEQINVINSNLNEIIVNAGPGMGKTSLLLGISEKNNNLKKGLLCFNTMIKQEIIEKTLKNNIDKIEVNTFHSLAFKCLSKRGEIKGFIKRNFENPLDYFSILSILKKLEMNTNNNFIHSILSSIINFCKSDLTFQDFFNKSPLKKEVLRIFEYLLNDEKAPMFHEFYIKIFQLILLQDKIINYELLMVDEFQDVSACYLSIIENINKNKIVKVGDTLQKIYGYNGALGMNQHDFKLSKSFRIGDKTALICNKLIDLFLNDKNLYMKGANKNQIICDIPNNENKTIIFRTNKGLIKRLIKETNKGQKCVISENLLIELNHIYKLVNVSIFYPYYFRGIKFTNRDMIYKLEKESKNTILKKTIELIEEFKDETKIVLYKLLQNVTTDINEGKIYFTTTHRCKGLEFQNVEIADDFYEIEKMLYNNSADYIDEMYILYVALTRSYGKLQLNEDLKLYFKC